MEELSKLFWAEAEENNVLPLLGGLTSFFGMAPPLPDVTKFVYRGDIQNIPSGMIPHELAGEALFSGLAISAPRPTCGPTVVHHLPLDPRSERLADE